MKRAPEYLTALPAGHRPRVRGGIDLATQTPYLFGTTPPEGTMHPRPHAPNPSPADPAALDRPYGSHAQPDVVRPYAAPPQQPAPLSPRAGYDDPETIYRIASAQRVVIFAILGGLGSIGLIVYGAIVADANPSLGGILFTVAMVTYLIAAVASQVGIYRFLRALGNGVGLTIFVMLLAWFVPFLSLFVLLGVNQKATQRLRAAGYEVGLMGANVPKPGTGSMRYP